MEQSLRVAGNTDTIVNGVSAETHHRWFRNENPVPALLTLQ
jgi:hypothetical protein